MWFSVLKSFQGNKKLYQGLRIEKWIWCKKNPNIWKLNLTNIIYILGGNILVSAFTIVVIAVDRWRSVVNTNPRENNLSYK